MSHSAVSINFMHMSNVTADAVVTVHKQHCDVHSPWSRRLLAVPKLCARACIMSRRGAGKGRFLWGWNHLLFAHSFLKDVISTRTANFKHTSSKIWPLISRKMDIGDFSNRSAPVYVNTQLNLMRRILSYIQLYICHGTDNATYRRVTNIYKKFASFNSTWQHILLQLLIIHMEHWYNSCTKSKQSNKQFHIIQLHYYAGQQLMNIW